MKVLVPVTFPRDNFNDDNHVTRDAFKYGCVDRVLAFQKANPDVPYATGERMMATDLARCVIADPEQTAENVAAARAHLARLLGETN